MLAASPGSLMRSTGLIVRRGCGTRLSFDVVNFQGFGYTVGLDREQFAALPIYVAISCYRLDCVGGGVGVSNLPVPVPAPVPVPPVGGGLPGLVLLMLWLARRQKWLSRPRSGWNWAWRISPGT